MVIRFAAATDVGKTREHNEDSYVVEPGLRLFAVADGMGGHAAGEVASRLAVNAVRDHLMGHQATLARYDHSDRANLEISSLLEQSIQVACTTVFENAAKDPSRRGMATTLSVLLLAGPAENPVAFLGHVGDSRIYLYRGGQTYQLTEDHAVKNELIRRGKVSRDTFDASRYSKFQSSVTRALGAYPRVEVDTMCVPLTNGDVAMLCSDGLYAYLDRPALNEHLRLGAVESLPESLVKLANDGGGHDNITCVAVSIGEGQPGGDDSFLDTFSDTPLGQSLSAQQRWQFRSVGRERKTKSGDVVFSFGGRSENIYYVVEGTVNIDEGGGRPRVASPGSWLGLEGLFDQSTYCADATCSSDCLLLAINVEQLLHQLESTPALGVRILWDMARQTNEQTRPATGRGF